MSETEPISNDFGSLSKSRVLSGYGFLVDPANL